MVAEGGGLNQRFAHFAPVKQDRLRWLQEEKICFSVLYPQSAKFYAALLNGTLKANTEKSSRKTDDGSRKGATEEQVILAFINIPF